MSVGKNVKRSVTYEFELTNSKMSTPVTRYKGYSKLYQLNLSKMLLKCPQSPFIKKDDNLNCPEQLLIVSTQKYNCVQQRNESSKCSSEISKARIQALRRNIKNNLLNQQPTSPQHSMAQIKQINQENSKTAASLNSPNIIDLPLPYQPDQSTARSLIKLTKNDIFRVTKKKINESTSQGYKQKQDIENDQKILKIQSQTFKSQQNNLILTINERKLQAKKKFSQNINLNFQQQVLKRNKISKKLLLPQIKQQGGQKNQNHTYNVSMKSNIPLLIRDPEQLKHVKAQSYSIIQYPTGNLILSHKGMNQYQIASLTKIMTFYATLQILKKYNLSISQQNVKINDIAMDMSGTSAQILSGQVYTVQQLLYGLMLPSGNDAATALAQWGGKHLLKNRQQHNTPSLNNNQTIAEAQNLKQRIKIFVNQMNYHAKELGLNSTRFANQHGLPNQDSKSTPIDVARLCFQCLKDNLFRKIVSTHSYKCNSYQYNNPQAKRTVQWHNTNKLLRREGFIGVKTGITVTAGPCLASAYQFRDKIYICVVLRASKVSRRFKQTRKLLAWSLQKLFSLSITAQQFKILHNLKKNKPDLDSDYSEDQQQFNYQQMNRAEFKKRSNIINYQM